MLGSSWTDTPGLPNRHYLYTSFPTVLCSSPHFSPHLVCWQPAGAGWRRDPSAVWGRRWPASGSHFCCEHMEHQSTHHLPALAEPFLLQCSWCTEVAGVAKLHLLSLSQLPWEHQKATWFVGASCLQQLFQSFASLISLVLELVPSPWYLSPAGDLE